MYYFLVYDDHTHTDYLKTLLDSIRKYGPQFEIIVFQKEDIHIDESFSSENARILSEKRGGGYWLWKPYIIHKTLRELKEEDILFYLDSKYYFIEDFIGLYQEKMKYTDILVWKNQPNRPIWYMKNWCKMDVIMKYEKYEKVFIEQIEDCWAGAVMIRKNDTSLQYIHEWLEMCCIYEDITDSPSILPNDSQFYDHRHDQSLLSIVLQKYNIKTHYFENKYLQNSRCPY